MKQPAEDVAGPRLEGAAVRLVALSREHVDELCTVGLDPELWRWTVSPVRTPEEMRGYVEAALRERDAGTALPFVIVLKDSRVVGSTRYGNVDLANKRVEIGWTWIAREWQRTAVNTETKYLMLEHAFESLGCMRVEFKTDALNERSRTALRRIGAQEEGVLRKHMLTASGRMRDSVYYSIVDEEWPAVKAALAARLADRRGDSNLEGESGSPDLGGKRDSPAPHASRRNEWRLANVRGSTGARSMPGGFELDDDPGRIDLAEVHRFLSIESYWARGRTRERVEGLVREASRVVGLYDDGGRQVGFARTVSDGTAFAYLADVYVLPALRGRGLGLELVREAVDRGPFADERWLLHTEDAHGLYVRLGFGPPSERVLERQRRVR